LTEAQTRPDLASAVAEIAKEECRKMYEKRVTGLKEELVTLYRTLPTADGVHAAGNAPSTLRGGGATYKAESLVLPASFGLKLRLDRAFEDQVFRSKFHYIISSRSNYHDRLFRNGGW
jgi:hypothetical protein